MRKVINCMLEARWHASSGRGLNCRLLLDFQMRQNKKNVFFETRGLVFRVKYSSKCFGYNNEFEFVGAL